MGCLKIGESMACPICRKEMCDCTPSDRGQTQKEIMADSYKLPWGKGFISRDFRKKKANKGKKK